MRFIWPSIIHSGFNGLTSCLSDTSLADGHQWHEVLILNAAASLASPSMKHEEYEAILYSLLYSCICKRTELIEKIAMLGGSHRKELLKRNMAYFNSRKHSNECILYTVDSIEAAIREKKRIAFNYFDLDEKKQRVFRPDETGEKKRYEVEPIALILNEDNYYLMAYSDHHPESTANYRVDRMDQVEVLEDSQISPEALAKLKTVRRYTAQTFKMFNGDCV